MHASAFANASARQVVFNRELLVLSPDLFRGLKALLRWDPAMHASAFANASARQVAFNRELLVLSPDLFRGLKALLRWDPGMHAANYYDCFANHAIKCSRKAIN